MKKTQPDINDYKKLASMAVFSQLHNDSKSIYDIIRAFICSYLNEVHPYSFSISSFAAGLNSFFNFSLPSSVIQTGLKKIKGITCSNGEYNVDYTEFPQETHFQIDERRKDNDEIIRRLITFVEDKKKESLQDNEKRGLLNDFQHFLLNEQYKSYFSNYISAFIIANKDDEKLRLQLNEIREGAIIYSGITTDADLARLGSWKNQLTIFLDTEILFHIAGFNGKYYKQQAEDFLTLIDEINKQEEYIHLRYFEYVANEIENFFYAAQDVVDKGALSDNSTAMKEITKGCKSRSDVIEKKSSFQLMLNTRKIIKDDYKSYYDDFNHRYNIVSNEFVVDEGLNYINILRKGKNKGHLNEIKYILITGTNDLLKQAWNSRIKGDGDIPLATPLDYMIERFWFTLNKGFGNERKPDSLDVLYKAKIVLSSVITMSIKEKYEENKRRFFEGTLTKEQVAANIINFRKESYLPENISKENIDDILQYIDENDVEKAAREYDLTKLQLNQSLNLNARQEEIIEDKNNIINQQKSQILQLTKELEERKQKELENEIHRQEAELKKKRVLFIFHIGTVILIAVVVVFCIYLFLIPLINDELWNLLARISTITTLTGGVAVFTGRKTFECLKIKKDQLFKKND